MLRTSLLIAGLFVEDYRKALLTSGLIASIGYEMVRLSVYLLDVYDIMLTGESTYMWFVSMSFAMVVGIVSYLLILLALYQGRQWKRIWFLPGLLCILCIPIDMPLFGIHAIVLLMMGYLVMATDFMKEKNRMPSIPMDQSYRGYWLLSFICPVVGWILYLFWKQLHPMRSLRIRQGSLYGSIFLGVLLLCIYIVFVVVFVLFLIFLAYFTSAS